LPPHDIFRALPPRTQSCLILVCSTTRLAFGNLQQRILDLAPIVLPQAERHISV